MKTVLTRPCPADRVHHRVHADFILATGTVAIVDGDTSSVGRERIRLLAIDTPETFRSRCENELVLGTEDQGATAPAARQRSRLDRARRP